MWRIIGAALVLYSVLPGFSGTLPFVASIVGPKVSVVVLGDPAACHDAVGSAPFTAFPQRCQVTWTTGQGEGTGTLYGEAVDGLAAGKNTPEQAVHELGNFAFTEPVGDAELRMALLAPLILFIGLYLLIRRRRGLGKDSNPGGSGSSGGGSSGGYGGAGSSSGGYSSGGYSSGGYGSGGYGGAGYNGGGSNGGGGFWNGDGGDGGD